MFRIQGGCVCSNKFKMARAQKFGCLKAILSWRFENLLGVLLLCKISRNLVEFKPFKTSYEFIFFQIRIDFLKKSSNFDPYELMYTNLHTKIFTLKHGKFEKILWRDNDFFTTFDKYYFALKQLKSQELWQTTNVFRFKTAENC